MGERGITWEIGGIFNAETENDACLAAAQETGAGTCFAVAGYAWGVDTLDPARVSKLGEQPDQVTRLERMGEKLANAMLALNSPAAKELPEGDSDGE